MPNEFPTRYSPKGETEIYKRWEESGAFAPSAKSRTGEYFSIVLPPPNVTGTLHIGHAVMLAIEDMMVRYHRMKGDRTVWIPGVDHAAIATQYVVEKKLKKENVQGRRTRHELGREAFVREVEQFAEQSKTRILEQIRAMGASLDWSRFAYTFDEQRKRAVREMFVRMYEAGILYRGNRIVNWCPRCKSTLADDEVEYREEKTSFYYFKYGPVVIGTARPETKFQDKTLVVHPEDERYKALVGKTFPVEWIEDQPLTSNVIADPIIDPTFGTGAMTITPAHSFDDFDLAQKHGLPIVTIIDEDGKLTEAAGSFAGRNAREARADIVAALQRKGLVDHIDEQYTHNLSVCYRCETPVEPLPKLQWFVAVSKPFRPRTTNNFSPSHREGEREGVGGPLTTHDSRLTTPMVSLKDLALEAVRSGEITILPERFTKEYFHWMENLRDWCISRQIWFGHRVPAKYCVACDGKKMLVVLRKPMHENDDELLGGSMFGFLKKYTLKQILDLGEVSSIGEGATPYFGGACDRCRGNEFIQDPDTLDTWFSSGMWTFSTLGWPEACAVPHPPAPPLPEEGGETKNDFSPSRGEGELEGVGGSCVKTGDLAAFHPTSVLETGYDILPFWVARMILMTEFALGEVPFRTVYLHGLVRDGKGRKMSKSLGDVIDPLDMTAKYGADAVRLALFIGTSPGQDTKLDEQKIAGYAKFVTKLWNIGRYVLGQSGVVSRAPSRESEVVSREERPNFESHASRLKTQDSASSLTPHASGIADAWILSKRDALIRDVTAAYEAHEYSKAAQMTYDFAWHEFADWYIEATKVASTEELKNQRTEEQRRILIETLEVILKLLHPAMPFVTEVLWGAIHLSASSRANGSELRDLDRDFSTASRRGRDSGRNDAGGGQLLIAQPWPSVVDEERVRGVAAFEFTRELVTAIRQIRNTKKIPPKTLLDLTLTPGSEEEHAWCADAEVQALLKHFARAREVRIVDRLTPPPAGGTTVRSTTVYVTPGI